MLVYRQWSKPPSPPSSAGLVASRYSRSREIANVAPMVKFEASLGILAPGWQDSALSLTTTPSGKYSPPSANRPMDMFDDSWTAPSVEEFLSNTPRAPASPRTQNTDSYAGRQLLNMSPRSPKVQSPRGSFLMLSRDEPTSASLQQNSGLFNAYSPMLTAYNTPLVSAPNSVYGWTPPISAPPSPRCEGSRSFSNQALPSPRVSPRGELGTRPPPFVSPRSTPRNPSGSGSAAAKPPTPKPRTAARPVRSYIPETHF